jgi:hypothetical protein
LIISFVFIFYLFHLCPVRVTIIICELFSEISSGLSILISFSFPIQRILLYPLLQVCQYHYLDFGNSTNNEFPEGTAGTPPDCEPINCDVEDPPPECEEPPTECPDGSIVPPGEDCPEPPEDGTPPEDGEDGSNGNEDDNENSGGIAPVPPFG